MKTTFYNPPSRDADQFKADSVAHLNSRQDDIRAYMDMDDPWDEDNEDLPPFSEYGLCFDAVECEKTGAVEYFRFQVSYGGPSEEYRFYPDGRIEFVYLDWFCGAGFDVTDTPQAQWLFDMYKELDMLNFQQEIAA